MLRRLSILFFIVSLAIWLMTAGVWVHGKLARSSAYTVGYNWERGVLEEVNSFGHVRVKRAGAGGHRADAVYVATYDGRFAIHLLHQGLVAGDLMSSEAAPGWLYTRGISLEMFLGASWTGFGSEFVREYKGWSFRLQVPQWFVLLVASPLPFLFIRRHIRRLMRIRQGHCVTCGYDLRASAGRCPECGSVQATSTRMERKVNESIDRATLWVHGRPMRDRKMLAVLLAVPGIICFGIFTLMQSVSFDTARSLDFLEPLFLLSLIAAIPSAIASIIIFFPRRSGRVHLAAKVNLIVNISGLLFTIGALVLVW